MIGFDACSHIKVEGENQLYKLSLTCECLPWLPPTTIININIKLRDGVSKLMVSGGKA